MNTTTQPDWTAEPPPEAVACVLDAAELAAFQDAPLARVAICESGIDERWKMFAAVKFLASLLRHHVVTPDRLRQEVLRCAQQTHADTSTTDAALAAVAMAEALERGDPDTIIDISHAASEMFVIDIAHSGAAIAGQTIAALGGDTKAAFDQIRRFYGLSDGAV